jgi:hypothetical protein
MTDANVFWEFGKYAVSLLLLLAILRWRIHIHPLPIFYFALLVPAIPLVIGVLGSERARQIISFNLSGPLTLAIAAIFFYAHTLDRTKFNWLATSIIVPILGIEALTLYSTLSQEQIIFVASSNLITSGGFGPNQISAILGLGTLLCWVYQFTCEKTASASRWLLLIIGMLFLIQAGLTLSRGGVYNLLIAIPPATYFFVRGNKKAWSLFIAGAAVVSLAFYFLLPYLNTYTQGMLLERFQDIETTSRQEMLIADLQIWRDNPLYGVGVGISSLHRQAILGFYAAAHTEYSRLLADHGLFGLMALSLLGVMFIQAFRKAKGNLARGIVLAFMLWSLAEMSHSATRIVAIPYLFAAPLAFLDLEKK